MPHRRKPPAHQECPRKRATAWPQTASRDPEGASFYAGLDGRPAQYASQMRSCTSSIVPSPSTKTMRSFGMCFARFSIEDRERALHLVLLVELRRLAARRPPLRGEVGRDVEDDRQVRPAGVPVERADPLDGGAPPRDRSRRSGTRGSTRRSGRRGRRRRRRATARSRSRRGPCGRPRRGAPSSPSPARGRRGRRCAR